MKAKINIFELTRQAFNIKGFAPILTGSFNPKINYDDSQIETIEVADAVATSVFGTPIFETLALIDPVTKTRIEFDDAPMITVNKKNHIIKSKVQGRSGSVKEFITEEDYIVNVRGVLVNHTGEDLPYDRINQINEIARLPQSIKVESKLLNLLGIHNLVIEELVFAEDANYTNVRPYQMKCLSDTPIELVL